MAVTNQFVQGYVTEFGNKYRLVIDHPGPSSYVQYNASTGAGDIINASDLGLGGFDTAHTILNGYSASGNYNVKVLLTKANDWTLSTTANIAGGAGKRVTVQWFTTSSAFGTVSTEVTGATDLSAEIVRLVFDGI